MNSTFYYSYTDATNYEVIQKFPWGEERTVPKDYDDLLTWINQGNTPEKVSGSPFVTISGGKVTFDSAGAATQEKESKLSQIEAAYYPQFAELKDAYLAALVLGDNTAIAANRVAYQTLLDEYNLKLEAIG